MPFKKENIKDEINTKKLNDVIDLTRILLRIAVVILVIAGIFTLISIINVLNIMPFIKTILKIVSPLFVGLVIAWLFDPFVTKLKKKGIRRGIGATIVYILFIGIVAIVIYSLIPLMSEQLTDLASMIPSIVDKMQSWLDTFLDNFAHIEGINVVDIKIQLFTQLENYGTKLTQSLPAFTVNLVSSFFSFMGTFIVGLIIGFYLLVGFDNVHSLLSFIPKKIRKDTIHILDDANMSLRSFVKGAVIDCTAIFVILSILFFIIGLKAPALFGLFCGITNIIPYAGPYIGGIPAVLVAFSQGFPTGILTLISIVVVQFIEGNLLQPIIMSKTTKLHPVTIMLGLLVFGYFFGIMGMVISTPIMAVAKSIFIYFDNKYEILNFLKKEETD